jgi:hypothetical protein
MELMNQEAGRLAIEKIMQTYGCLPSAGDGPVLSAFDSTLLADALDSEVNRARDYGWSKITIHLDIPDAAKLAAHLRK